MRIAIHKKFNILEFTLSGHVIQPSPWRRDVSDWPSSLNASLLSFLLSLSFVQVLNLSTENMFYFRAVNEWRNSNDLEMEYVRNPVCNAFGESIIKWHSPREAVAAIGKKIIRKDGEKPTRSSRSFRLAISAWRTSSSYNYGQDWSIISIILWITFD